MGSADEGGMQMKFLRRIKEKIVGLFRKRVAAKWDSARWG
jgi:hypothetical protein